jgi:hypothetical protein
VLRPDGGGPRRRLSDLLVPLGQRVEPSARQARACSQRATLRDGVHGRSIATFNLIAARSFTASDTGGVSILPSGNQNKLRTSGMGTTLLTDARISQTATLSAGTRTKDAQGPRLDRGWRAQHGGCHGRQILLPYPIFDQRPGEHPLVLAQNEGFVIRGHGASDRHVVLQPSR